MQIENYSLVIYMAKNFPISIFILAEKTDAKLKEEFTDKNSLLGPVLSIYMVDRADSSIWCGR